MSHKQVRPFVPEGEVDISFMLGDLCTIGRFTEDIPVGATEVVQTWTKTEDVVCAVQPARQPISPQYAPSAYGTEQFASHLIFLLIGVDVAEGDLIRINSGPYTGQHVEVTYVASYAGSHHEVDGILHKEYTKDDELG